MLPEGNLLKEESNVKVKEFLQKELRDFTGYFALMVLDETALKDFILVCKKGYLLAAVCENLQNGEKIKGSLALNGLKDLVASNKKFVAQKIELKPEKVDLFIAFNEDAKVGEFTPLDIADWGYSAKESKGRALEKPLEKKDILKILGFKN
jgi:hypothetical protein